MKKTNTIKFWAIFVVTILLVYLAVAGLQIGKNFEIKGVGKLRTGIDIRGGVSAQLAPVEGEVQEGKDISKELEAVKELIDHRLQDNGISDSFVSVDDTNNRVIVEIPWKADEKEFNATELIEETIAMSRLTFWEVEPYSADTHDKKGEKPETYMLKDDFGREQGEYVRIGEMILEGNEVRSAEVANYQENGYEDVVSLEFNSEATQKFADATGRLAGKGQIGIFMDDDLISAPQVNEKIASGSCQIEGNFTGEEAIKLAGKIRSGNLPFKLEAVQINSISATLGAAAYNLTGIALIIALILVALFMIIFYRLPGVIAAIALMFHTALSLLFYSNLGVTITLPGMAGIILALGMAVDANVIIFERIKEEIALGKTLRASVDAGFKRAFSAVFDSNVTSIICGAVLYFFGSGAIKSFALTSLIGVTLSFFSAVTASRWMLQATANWKITAKPGFYAKAKKVEVKEGE